MRFTISSAMRNEDLEILKHFQRVTTFSRVLLLSIELLGTLEKPHADRIRIILPGNTCQDIILASSADFTGRGSLLPRLGLIEPFSYFGIPR